MADRMSEKMPDRMSEYMSDLMPDKMSDRMPDKMSAIECLKISEKHVHIYVLTCHGGDHTKSSNSIYGHMYS